MYILPKITSHENCTVELLCFSVSLAYLTASNKYHHLELNITETELFLLSHSLYLDSCAIIHLVF